MILVPSVKGNVKAAVTVRTGDDDNGWLTWRRLCRGGPTFVARPVSGSGNWADAASMELASFFVQLTEWQEDLQKWELESVQRWDHGTKVSMVALWALMEYPQLLRTGPAAVTSSFASLREAIENYYHRGETYGSAGVASSADSRMPQPMELVSAEKGGWIPRAFRKAAADQRGTQQ